MKVSTLMTKTVHACGRFDTLDQIARTMWEHGLGAMPVVDEHGRAIGMITDRDLAMAAYTQGKPLSDIPVCVAASKTIVTARPDESIDLAHERMREAKIRRLPVVDDAGTLLGILSINDLARRFAGARARQTDGTSADSIAQTVAAISEPRIQPAVYRIRAGDPGWDVFDATGARIAHGLRTQVDAVVHAKALATRNGSAEVIVYDADDRIASDHFYRVDEHSAPAEP